jgi:Leucine-rich repeat (LRR) protein
MADELIEILNNEPEVDELNLDYKDIEDLGELLPILSQFQNLRVLSLADNRMIELPEDLSSLHSVEDINVNGNQFQDLKQVIV